MRFNKTLDQGEPQSQPAVTSGFGSVFLPETFKHKGNKIRGNALAGIVNMDHKIVTVIFASNFHHATGQRKLDRVVQKIYQRLAQTDSIAGDDFVLPIS